MGHVIFNADISFLVLTIGTSGLNAWGGWSTAMLCLEGCLGDTPGLAEIWAIYVGRRAAAGPALGRNRRVRIGEAWAGHAFGLAGEVILIDLG